MSNKSTRASLTLPEVSVDQDNDIYVKLIDLEGNECYDQEPEPITERRIGWLAAAFLSLFCFTASNYIAGTQTGDIFAGKIANSMSLGLIGMLYTAYCYKTGKQNFLTILSGNDSEEYGGVPRQEKLKAIGLSFLCGLINAVGMTSLYIAFNDATNNGMNISIWAAILSGNCIFGLIASFIVFDDQISIFQTSGVFINLGGVLLVSLGNGTGGVTLLMVFGSAMAATCIGTRIILSRYWTSRLDPITFMNINFMADFIFGLVWVLVSVFGYFEFQFEFKPLFIVFWGGAFAVGADIFLFIGIERGIAGAVVSVSGSNGIIVGLLNWMIQGATPSFVQAIAITIAFIGIITMSLGDIVVKCLKRSWFS